MTQFPHSGSPYAASAAPPPWSGFSIAAFIVSFLGCTIIGAVLGLIFAVVGFFDARGGRRRGIGLAVAAIPISLLMGSLGGFGWYAVAKVAGEVTQASAAVRKVLVTSAAQPDEAVKALREYTSEDFDKVVNDEQLVGWITKTYEKHGKMTSAEANKSVPFLTSGGDTMDVFLEGKFVNGPAPIKLRIRLGDPKRLIAIDDFEVDAVSPRSAEP